ncbi:P450-derived glycosyltransferase activator [Streptomyces sp. M41]|uniref:cytochrome P450 family protein n=1 Tax=Streptomyces sp. M41 TaxID=3059412 RepID=UPI00374CE7E9
MSVSQDTGNPIGIGELGRRLQRAQGEVWLRRVQGDPYADLLRGHAEDPRPCHERIRALGPLWRSSMGAWVTADHGLAATLLGEPWPYGPVTGDDVHVPVDGAGLGGDTAHYERLRRAAQPLFTPAAVTEVCRRAVAELGSTFDLVTDLAERVPVDLLADRFGLPPEGRRDLADACAAAGVVLDGLLCPQRLDVTRRAVTAVDRLPALLASTDDEQATEAAVLLAAAGVRTTARLVTSAVEALVDRPEEWSRVADDPAYAAPVVAEVLRHDSPVQLHAVTARAAGEFAGQRVAAGERVVVLVGAANRDPEVFADPDRFEPGRPADALLPGLHHRVTLPFARAQAEAVLRALVAAGPPPRRSGPPLRSRRSPVTRHLLSCPLATG